MEELTFKGQSFLMKEAAPNIGRFVLHPMEAAVNPENLHLFGPEEVAAKAREEAAKESSGSFLTDGLLGLTKKVAPATKETINNVKGGIKGSLERFDTSVGSALAGKNPDSIRGKFWSAKVQHHVGDIANSNDKFLREGRRPSALAPMANTLKVGTPLLAAAYVGEKLYPANQNQQMTGQNSNQAPYDNNFPKQAEEVFDPHLAGELDKVASMQKIAELEETISKYASQLEEIEMEKVAVEKRLKETEKEKDYFSKEANEAKSNLMEKEAEFEELRLRTIAQKRSKVAVDLAEQLLTVGFIKQAELSGMMDDLMECDESTIKRYHNLVKTAKTQEESLESLAILGEYKGNEKLAGTTKDLAAMGLSKSGQSIADAVRDLTK